MGLRQMLKMEYVSQKPGAFMAFLDQIPLPYLVIAALTLGLAPFFS